MFLLTSSALLSLSRNIQDEIKMMTILFLNKKVKRGTIIKYHDPDITRRDDERENSFSHFFPVGKIKFKETKGKKRKLEIIHFFLLSYLVF